MHLATGNYNDRTARLYSDIGLMTCDRDIASDVAAFFNLLTGLFGKRGLGETGHRSYRAEATFPRSDRPRNPGLHPRPSGADHGQDQFAAGPGNLPGLVPRSQAGVKIMLNVRGICCLRPGVPGVSENIEVRSIVDRFLEHSRIFYFRNGGHEEVYLSGADWMQRNLSGRLEILFPVIDPNLRRRLIKILETFFADNVKACRLLPDGSYEPVARNGPKIRAQQKFYQEALAAVREAVPRRAPIPPTDQAERITFDSSFTRERARTEHGRRAMAVSGISYTATGTPGQAFFRFTTKSTSQSRNPSKTTDNCIACLYPIGYT